MAITTMADMKIVPEKFTEYTIQRTTEKSALARAGIATPDALAEQLMAGTPEGGRFITLPHINPLDGDDEVFGEQSITVGGITTDDQVVTLLMRQRAWGASDLSHVLSGADPMAAVGEMVSDWWVAKEQAVYLSILAALLDPAKGTLKEHVNDISAKSGEAGGISVESTLDSKQLMGDAFDKLGVVFMHSATYTALQKQQQIVTEYSSDLKVKFDNYLGYQVVVDDGMPVKGSVYDTYFIGAGAFVRQDGTPAGFMGTETDRDKLGAKSYLINRRCMVIHPRGISWNKSGSYTDPTKYYPANVDLAKPENWKLVVDHKNVPIVCLRHKI